MTDRNCESENIAKKYGYENMRILYSENFDAEAANYLFDKNQVDIVILLYSRLVSDKLYKNRKCINIHPALLPAFPGMNAVNQARDKKVLYMGVTSHYVDKGIDTGKIISQVVIPIFASDSVEEMNSKSHFLKVFTFLQILSLIFPAIFEADVNFDHFKHPLANPSLKDKTILNAFYDYADKENQFFRYL